MAVFRIQYDVEGEQDIMRVSKSLDNLEESTEKATEASKDLSSTSDDTAGSVDDLGDAVGDAANQVSIFGVGLGDASKKLLGAAKSSNVLTTALKAIPLVAIATALASIATFLTSTERGQQRWQKTVAAGNAILSVFRDRLSAVGELLLKSGDGAVKSESGFAKLLKTFVRLNPITLGLQATLLSLRKVFPELTKEIEEEAKTAARLANAFFELEKIELGFAVQRAQANAELERNKLIAEDITRSFEERAVAAQRALAIETEFSTKEAAAARLRVSLIQQQQAPGENIIEDRRKLAQAQIELANIEQASLTRQIELNNKINQIEKERAAFLQAQFDLQDVEEAKTLERREADLGALDEQLEKELEVSQARIDAAIEVDAAEQRLAEGDKRRREERVQEELATLETLVGTSAQLIGDLTGFGKATAIVQATIDTFAGANKAFQQGGVLGFITGAAIIARGLANVARIRSQEVPQFAEGVIGINGPGTEKSDSIDAKLSKGESVMTARETREFLPTLKAIRKGNIDAELINSIASGGSPEIIDISRPIYVERSTITMDETGFSQHIVNRGNRLVKKQNKYRANLFG